MGCIALVRCVLVLRCGLAGVVWFSNAGFNLTLRLAKPSEDFRGFCQPLQKKLLQQELRNTSPFNLTSVVMVIRINAVRPLWKPFRCFVTASTTFIQSNVPQVYFKAICYLYLYMCATRVETCSTRAKVTN